VSKKGEIQPHWRPDFRNPSTLPDIKVIRTDFIVNGIAIACLLVAVFLAGRQEYTIMGLGGESKQLSSEIQAGERADKQAVALSQRFRDAGKAIEDLERFYRAPFFAHDLAYEMAALRDDRLIFSNLSFDERSEKTAGKRGRLISKYSITLSGDVKELRILDLFVERLRDSDILNVEGFTLEVSETPQRPNEETGLYPFSVQIELEPGENAKLKEAKQ